VIEGAGPYLAADHTLRELAGSVLHPSVVSALTEGEASDYRFDADLRPYQHQLESWKHLTSGDSQSVLVTSGTGSGKTECFLVPLLDDLARELDQSKGNLSGVRAIMLYPLNALIASQEERLRQWTAPFGGSIRFGLYNGLTPEDLREGDRRAASLKHPEQVIDRKTMRNDPPPILVTNVTMLEYMTIRREDRPLVENSRGKLRWIIIDEAHSYVGSAAAEISLLIRRVLQTFGVSAHEVRFVATSATIGGQDKESSSALQRFLADLAGIETTQVHVVQGHRALVELPPLSGSNALQPSELADPTRLARNPVVQKFVRAAEAKPISASEADAILAPSGLDPTSVVEAIASDAAGGPILPLRIHQFLRAVPGLWSCLNGGCSGARPADWPFGALAFERADRCRHCKSPLFEVHGCHDCGEPFLAAFDQGDRLTPLATPPEEDEFAAAAAQENERNRSDDDEQSQPRILSGPARKRVIAARSLPSLRSVSVDERTGSLPEEKGVGSPLPMTALDWDGSCPHCLGADEEGQMRPFRFGAPFLIGNAAPVILEGVRPLPETEGILPASGRRLLSFTDSRQGTARFAASIETNAERSYVRGYLYHLAQKAAQPDVAAVESIARKREEVEKIEAAAVQVPSLAEIARKHRAELEQLEAADTARGVSWEKARQALAADPMVDRWIRAVWRDRDARFERQPDAFAEFLLLRELARRPRRANAIETLGLGALRFGAIEQVLQRPLPSPLSQRGHTHEEWRDFLYQLIDTPVRSYFALAVGWDDVRWLLPRGGVRRNLVPPGDMKRHPSDLAWATAKNAGTKSTPVVLLERSLNLDSSSGADRAEINEILAAAWDALRPLFDSAGPEYSLNLSKAEIVRVNSGWLCPVTRRVLTHLVFGKTAYGQREGSPLSSAPPLPLKFPILPVSFPQKDDQRARIEQWLASSSEVAALKELGVWRDLHDRAALLAPYIRAEEHSAQQPATRLRQFETAFKAGEINMLACSTTMEMGVDIGSVSAVLMTNVPPSIANYRQRVGRAGRRGQGFASSLTLARDTPLDRETFKQPAQYLAKVIRPPRVKLDAPRIVQRHVNALLLATWFSEAHGELLKIKTGAFFGFPEKLDQGPADHSPVDEFCQWLDEPGVRARLLPALQTLTRGTALEADAALCSATRAMFVAATRAFERQWTALRKEAELAPTDPAKASVGLQLKRLCRENLLKELANRALLPGHGFPTSVLPFVNDCRESRARAREDGQESAAGRRYDWPSRNADIAIREYAPGTEIVIDGLVWRSAGVTLNWQRPAHEDDVREIQSLRAFWSCPECGAADCTRSFVDSCPVCGATSLERRRFLEPAGFRVDWDETPHADTDQIAFIEPEPARISARDASWEPLLDPALGRGRASNDGLVFFSSVGASRCGYRICLDCGRAHEDHGDGTNPLARHSPLRGTKPGDDPECPGGSKPFAVTEPVALGSEILTDVAELQPAALVSLGGAWAFVSALREALSRRLGIETGELGMGVEARMGALAQPTHSLFLFDRNSGGAGFATRLFDDLPMLLENARYILECRVAGCERGCSACILTADLFKQQEIIDRKAALNCVEALLAGMAAPQDDDRLIPSAKLSPPVADALARRIGQDDAVTVFSTEAFDVSALMDEPFASLFELAIRRGAQVRIAIPDAALNSMDAAQRLGLRDAAVRHRVKLCTWRGNKPTLIASLKKGATETAWVSRDPSSTRIGSSWGVGQSSAVVCGDLAEAPTEPIHEDRLLPKASTAVHTIEQDNGRPLRLFGDWITKIIQTELEPLGLWKPGELSGITYSDRYLRSPLTVALALRSIRSIRDALNGKGSGLPVRISTLPLPATYARANYYIYQDWQRPDDREQVIRRLAETWNLDLKFDEACSRHARELHLQFTRGTGARLYFDQGFGFWRTGKERFDFGASPSRQALAIEHASVLVAGPASTYIAIEKV
jgi:superfamily II DNA or RNA helicase